MEPLNLGVDVDIEATSADGAAAAIARSPPTADAADDASGNGSSVEADASTIRSSGRSRGRENWSFLESGKARRVRVRVAEPL